MNEIRVFVKFMSVLADMAGSREISATLAAGATLADLVNSISARFGLPLAKRLGHNADDPFACHVVAVVDGQFYGDPSVSPLLLQDGMTVIFMEPVAGGAQFEFDWE